MSHKDSSERSTKGSGSKSSHQLSGSSNGSMFRGDGGSYGDDSKCQGESS